MLNVELSNKLWRPTTELNNACHYFLQNIPVLQKLSIPNYFQKFIFSLKTLEIGKCLQLQQNVLVLNASPFFTCKFCWILNLVRLSSRYWPHTCDVCYSALLSPTWFCGKKVFDELVWWFARRKPGLKVLFLEKKLSPHIAPVPRE